jgi:hypothetical protein
MEIARASQINGFNLEDEYNIEILIRPLTNESKQIIYNMLDFVINLDSLEEDAVYILNKEYNKKLNFLSISLFYSLFLILMKVEGYNGRS